MANTSSQILLYEDNPDHVTQIVQEIRKLDDDVEVWRCTTIGLQERRETPTDNARKPIDEVDWASMSIDQRLAAQLVRASVVVIDLQLAPSECNCSECNDGLHGFHILQRAADVDCLHRTLVVSGEIQTIKKAKSDLHNKLSQYVANGLSVFRKVPDPVDLAKKIMAWARFEKLGYYADHETRDKLYRAGQQGGNRQPEHVLILGPSGSGKQQAAEFIHRIGSDESQARGVTSPVGSGALAMDVPSRFEPVLCGGLIETGLATSQLFGHTKGAYSDASRHRAGKLIVALGWTPREKKWDWDAKEDLSTDFREWLLAGQLTAKDGNGNQRKTPMFEKDDDGNLWLTPQTPVSTVFLDEFQDLPATVQALLLRVIDQGEMEPMGFDGKIFLRSKMIDGSHRTHLRFVGASNSKQIREQCIVTEGSAASSEPKSSQGQAAMPGVSVRQDLISRLSDWLVDLKPVTAAEVGFLIDQEIRHRSIDIRWSSDARTRLKQIVDSTVLPGNRRQVRQFVLRASALATYEKQGRLEPATAVGPEHVDQAIAPIAPAAQVAPDSPGSPTESAAFTANLIDLVVEKITELAGSRTKALSSEDYNKLLEGLREFLTSKFPALRELREVPAPDAMEPALQLVATTAIDRLKQKKVKWRSQSDAGNRTARAVPNLTRVLMEADKVSRAPQPTAVERVDPS